MSVSKEALTSLSPCHCKRIDALADAVVDKAEADGLDEGQAQHIFESIIDPNCEGEKENPNNFCGNGCSIPEMICGDPRGANFLLKQTMEIRGVDLSL